MSGYGIVVLWMFGKDYQAITFPNIFVETKIKKVGNTISWYSDDSDSQLNASNTYYYFAAIGGYDMGGAD